ncbi:hypothetical protein [Flavobacterium caseinilyticum]|uniref:Uncharacterized protein n=1 Tax=Flavobacterium caseinilyticum TaxID=2541732 RepID=A0A4R5AUW4_9FLAO|nr:hypothetical protein [Flavobacterium caseinilyticum]TDD77148.1 hypothetical protein E0F89_05990 [Flavobacterium caseinilyticum]
MNKEIFLCEVKKDLENKLGKELPEDIVFELVKHNSSMRLSFFNKETPSKNSVTLIPTFLKEDEEYSEWLNDIIRVLKYHHFNKPTDKWNFK